VYVVIPVRAVSSLALNQYGSGILVDTLDRDSVSSPTAGWPDQGTLFAAWALPSAMNYKAAMGYTRLVDPARILVFTGSVLLDLGEQYRGRVVLAQD
jgi:hypothetical protein